MTDANSKTAESRHDTEMTSKKQAIAVKSQRQNILEWMAVNHSIAIQKDVQRQPIILEQQEHKQHKLQSTMTSSMMTKEYDDIDIDND